jgi:preprotein translocase subunit SecE
MSDHTRDTAAVLMMVIVILIILGLGVLLVRTLF